MRGDGIRNTRAAGNCKGGDSGACGNQQRVRMAVIAAIKFDDHIPAGNAARQSDGAHGGFGAGIDHSNHFNGRNCVNHKLGQFNFQISRGAKAGSAFQDAADGFHHCWMAVAQNHGAPGPDIINVGVAIHINDHAAIGMMNERRNRSHGFAGPDRAVDSAGNDFYRLLKKLM